MNDSLNNQMFGWVETPSNSKTKKMGTLPVKMGLGTYQKKGLGQFSKPFVY